MTSVARTGSTAALIPSIVASTTSAATTARPVPQSQLTFDGGKKYVADVVKLQNALVHLGHLSQADMNTGPGYFGNRTKAALAKFQAKSGIADDGTNFGPQTRAALTKALTPTATPPKPTAPTPTTPAPTNQSPVPQVQLTFDGGKTYQAEVVKLQKALVKLGHLSQADMNTGPGYYGNRTKAAVAKLQAKWGIADDGTNFGPQTRAALTKALNGEAPPKQPTPTQPTPQNPPGNIPKFDGITPAPGAASPSNSALPANPPFTNAPGQRSAAAYNAVIDQFAVQNNYRYKKNKQGIGETYCNIFMWDVTRAMGAEIPHWINGAGDIKAAASAGSWEADANANARWLRDHGPRHGWTAVTAEQAQAAANQGKPVVFAWNNPGGIGHVGMVRPGTYDSSRGPAIAQAGAQNINHGRIRDIFGSIGTPVYYVHA